MNIGIIETGKDAICEIYSSNYKKQIFCFPEMRETKIAKNIKIILNFKKVLKLIKIYRIELNNWSRRTLS